MKLNMDIIPLRLTKFVFQFPSVGNTNKYRVSIDEPLHFQNDTENKCGILRNSHPHQSIEILSKFCFKWPGWLLLLHASA